MRGKSKIIESMWDEWTTANVSCTEGHSRTHDLTTSATAECAGLLAGLIRDELDKSDELNEHILRPKHLRVARRLLKLWRKTKWFATWNIADRMTLPTNDNVNINANVNANANGTGRVTIRLPVGFRGELLTLVQALVQVQDSQDSPASAFLRGLWGACGSLYLPKSGYYLVLRVSSCEVAVAVREILSRTGLSWKERKHYGAQEFTLRDIESIVTFLCNIELHGAALALEDKSIVRSMRDQANRVRNCDGANIKRTVISAREQVKLAENIMRSNEFAKLSASLRELIEVRLANPEASLGELGEKLSQPLTKSTVRYKWQRLKEQVMSNG